jgi:threonine dehydrogenase-like Zn-dependent dehydrogenase
MAEFRRFKCDASGRNQDQMDPVRGKPGGRFAGFASTAQAASYRRLPHRRTGPGPRLRHNGRMKALTYQGAKKVRVETVPDPILSADDDILLRVTATAICGSDLHIYRGKIPMVKDGDILGHEFMGVVEDAGPGVTKVRKGDRVVIPFVIACGQCFYCNKALFAACESTNDGRGAILNKKSATPGAALFGYSHLYGGVPGGQAEYVRVPKANVGPLVVPDALADEQVLFLSDILMSALSARFMGADKIFMVDHHEYRLKFAQETYGVIPINFDQDEDPAEVILKATRDHGVDATIDAVGFEAKGSAIETTLTNLKMEGSSGKALRQCIAATRRGGVVSVPGVYAGFIHGFLFGDAFDKGLTFKMGQTHAQQFMPQLLELIGNGELKPEVIISHRMKLADAEQGYKVFNEKEEDCRKVVLTP